jgi:hypothetical protein
MARPRSSVWLPAVFRERLSAWPRSMDLHGGDCVVGDGTHAGGGSSAGSRDTLTGRHRADLRIASIPSRNDIPQYRCHWRLEDSHATHQFSKHKLSPGAIRLERRSKVTRRVSPSCVGSVTLSENGWLLRPAEADSRFGKRSRQVR